MTGNQEFRDELKKNPETFEATRDDYNLLCQEYDEALSKGQDVLFFKYENAPDSIELTVQEAKQRIAFMKDVYDLEDKHHPIRISIKY